MQTLFYLLKIELKDGYTAAIVHSPMGFDIHIQMILYMCPASGKPYSYMNSEKAYGLPDVIVPKKLCKYLVGRGHIFHAYTEYFNSQETYCVSAEEFLEHFPSWEEVVEHENYSDEDGWAVEDHRGFQALLEWCVTQEVSFQVSWSY